MNKKFIALLTLVSISASAGIWKDIPYYEKDAPKQGNLQYLEERCKLDLETPAKRTKFPTLVWLHGGGLKKGGKKHRLWLLGTEAAAILLALGLTRYFESLPGTGFMPGLTYFAHAIYSMAAALVYGCLLLVSLLLFLWQRLRKK